LLVGAVVAVVVLSVVPRRLTRRQALLGLAALVAWRVAYTGAPILIKAHGHWWLVAAALAVVLAAGLALLLDGRYLAAAPVVLAVPLAWIRVAGHAGVAAALVILALAGTAAFAARPSRAATPAAR